LHALSFSSLGARARPRFYALGFAIIARYYYTELCTIHWSSYHGSSAKLVQYNGVISPHSNAKVIEILKKISHCYVMFNVKAFPPFQPKINSTKTQIN